MGRAYDAAKTFVHLGSDGRTVPLEVTETFFQDLTSGALGDLGAGRLFSLFEFDAPWDSWEIHPAGDEIVILMEGSVEMTLEPEDGGERDTVSIHLPGQYVIIPQGTWHTARTEVPTRMLFITDGEGTRHRPV